MQLLQTTMMTPLSMTLLVPFLRSYSKEIQKNTIIFYQQLSGFIDREEVKKESRGSSRVRRKKKSSI
jgi:hypothetical protein